MYEKRKKAAVLLLCAALILAALFADSFLVHAVGHKCTGADCPVCACVEQIAGQFKRSAARAARFGSAVLHAPQLAVTVGMAAAGAAVLATPVAQRVRLNN